MPSIVYRHPLVYQSVMRLLYGWGYASRFSELAEHIDHGAEVVDICAGDGMLYERCLKNKSVKYVGLDMNPIFVNAGMRRGFDFRLTDVTKSPLPGAEYVIMQGSLYQFLPHASQMLERMLEASRRFVIIAEPVKNLSDSKNPLLRAIAQRSANPGDGDKTDRFTEASLDELMKKYTPLVRTRKLIAHGRELLFVLDKNLLQEERSRNA